MINSYDRHELIHNGSKAWLSSGHNSTDSNFPDGGRKEVLYVCMDGEGRNVDCADIEGSERGEGRGNRAGDGQAGHFIKYRRFAAQNYRSTK